MRGALIGVHEGVALLTEDRRRFWVEAIREAEQRSPPSFTGVASR